MVATLLLLLTACGDFGLVPTVEEPGGGTVGIDPSGEIRFDRTSPHGRSQSEEVAIVSTGDLPIYVADVWVESDATGVFYTNDELPFPKTMEPGDSVPVTIRFSPNASGDFSGALVVESGVEGTLLERRITGEGCSDSDRDGEC